MRQYETKVGGVYYFRRVVPDDLVGAFTTANGKSRTEWKISTRAKDRGAARTVLQRLETETDKLIAQARAAQHSALTAPATAGQPFAAAMAIEAEAWSHELAKRRAERDEREAALAASDPAVAVHIEILDRMRANDERAEQAEHARYRELERRHSPSVRMIKLFERYAATPGRNPKTIQQWRPYFVKLAAFIGHDDASRLTLAELRTWRNHLRDEATFRGRRLSAKTINGSYLAAINVVLSWAADDGALPSNPARDLKPVNLPARPELRSRVMSEGEAQIVLTAALAGKSGGGRDSMANARRWLPWLMCYSGARVGEVAQLRKEDVRDVGGIPAMCITPDAGTVKSRKARKVPLHPHLIEQGFLAFVAGRGEGPLFFDASKRRSDGAINRQSNKVGSNLAAWVRSLGVNPPQPNHAWRHRFITLSQRHELTERASSAIVGHTQQGQHRAYGDDELDVLLRELSKLPPVILP